MALGLSEVLGVWQVGMGVGVTDGAGGSLLRGGHVAISSAPEGVKSYEVVVELSELSARRVCSVISGVIVGV